MENFIWFDKCIRQVHIDLHTPEIDDSAFRNFDARKVVELLEKTGVQAVKFFAKDHYGNAYYQTQYGHIHKYMRGDLLKEFINAAHEKNIFVMAYYSVGWDEQIALRYPHWRQKDSNGNCSIVGMASWRGLCFNSPYTEKIVLPQLGEIVSSYDVDGIWLDMVTIFPGMCYCHFCQKKFRGLYNVEMNKHSTVDKQGRLREFHNITRCEFLKKVRGTLDSLHKKIPFIANGACSLWWDKKHHRYLDFGSIEVGPQSYGYSLLHCMGRYARAQGKPFELVTSRFIKGWGDWTLKPEAQLKYECSVIMSLGGKISLGDQMRYDGTLEPAVYDRFKNVFKYTQERDAFCLYAQPVRHTVFIKTGPDYMSDGVMGAEKLLSELHLQYDIINEDELGNLDRYKVAIIEPEWLPKGSLVRLKDFVRNGGSLLVCGDVFLKNRNKELWQDLLGVSVKGRSSYEVMYLYPAQKIGLMQDYPPFLINQKGIPFLVVKDANAQPLFYLMNPIIKCTGRIEARYSHFHAPAGQKTKWPAAISHNLGCGKVLYIPFSAFTLYRNYPDPAFRELFDSLINTCFPEKPFDIKNVPPSLLADLSVKGKEYILHLIYFCEERSGGSSIPSIESESVCGPFDIVFYGKKPKKILLEPDKIRLPFIYNAGKVKITISLIKGYSIVRIMY